MRKCNRYFFNFMGGYRLTFFAKIHRFCKKNQFLVKKCWSLSFGGLWVMKELETPKTLFWWKNACHNFFQRGLRNKNADKNILILPIFWSVGSRQWYFSAINDHSFIYPLYSWFYFLTQKFLYILIYVKIVFYVYFTVLVKNCYLWTEFFTWIGHPEYLSTFL